MVYLEHHHSLYLVDVEKPTTTPTNYQKDLDEPEMIIETYILIFLVSSEKHILLRFPGVIVDVWRHQEPHDGLNSISNIILLSP